VFLFFSISVYARDYNDYSSAAELGYFNQKYDPNLFGVAAEFKGYQLGFTQYLKSISVSDHPVDERPFVGKSSSISAKLNLGNGHTKFIGTDASTLTLREFKSEFLYFPDNATAFALAGINASKLTADGRNLGSNNFLDAADTVSSLVIGGGTYIQPTTAIFATYGRGKESEYLESYDTPPNYTINSAGVGLKQLVKQQKDSFLSILINYGIAKTKGTEPTGVDLAKNEKTIKIDLKYYPDLISSFGIVIEDRSIKDDNIPGYPYFGDAKTTSFLYKRYFSPTLAVQLNYSKIDGGNFSTADGRIFSAGISRVF